MKKILPNLSSILLLLFLFGQTAYAAEKDCGIVTIEDVLTGPQHGAMMQMSNHSCGNGGWVCLDPNNEHMSAAESQRLFSFVLTMYLHGRPIHVQIYEGVYAKACGNYPVAFDVRMK